MVQTKTTLIALTYKELTTFLELMFAGTPLADEMENFGHCNGFSSLFMNAMRQGEKGRTDFFRRIEIIRELLRIMQTTPSISSVNTVPQHLQDLIQEIITGLGNQTNNQQPSFFVTGDRPILEDLVSFAQELVVYHNPSSFPALFEGALKEPVGQVAELVYPLMYTPKDYQTCSVEKLSVGIYNKTEFLSYFARLRQALEAKPSEEKVSPNPAVSFLMGTTTHSISISYDKTSKKWFLSDSEDINKEYLVDGTTDTQKLAEWVFNALVRKDIDDSIAFSSTLFADTPTVDLIKETLKKDSTWQAIHDSTRKDCLHFISYNNIRLLHILVAEAELNTIAHYLDHVKKLSTSTPSFFNTTNYLDQILNAQDKFGYTPLMFAIDKADFERVDLLLKYNPDVHLKTKDSELNEGQTALELAQSNLKQYQENGGSNQQIIESYSKIIDALEKFLKINTLSTKRIE